jgi:hypothetical protein
LGLFLLRQAAFKPPYTLCKPRKSYPNVPQYRPVTLEVTGSIPVTPATQILEIG